MKIKLFLLTILMGYGIVTSAQQGIIKGIITDKQTGEELVGAAVIIDGTTIGTITNFMGEYELPPISDGTYNIRAQFISYDPILIENVKISNGEVETINIQLSAATMDIDEVQVVAKANRESETLLLLEQKKAVIAATAIGAQELSRKGVSDAEGAVTKVSGISKQEGVKNVFVRGLGDRYNSTTFNGFPVPSEDPEYKNLALDLFSSDVIQTVGVEKVFSATTGGDVGGANIDISSKQLIKDSEFSLNIATGGNTQTTGNSFMNIDGVNSFGFPTSNPSTPAVSDLTQYSFANSLNPEASTAPVNYSFGASGGKRFLVGENKNPLDFYVVGSFSSDYSYKEGNLKQIVTTGEIDRDQDFENFEQVTSQLMMGNLSYKFKKHQLSYNTMMVHTNNQSYSEYEGFDGNRFQGAHSNNEGLMIRQQVNDNTLLVNQFISDWYLNDKMNLNVGVSHNLVVGNEPDRRVNHLIKYQEEYRTLMGRGFNQRYFSELRDNDLNFKAALTIDINDNFNNNSNLEFGYDARLVDGSFRAEEYEHVISKQGSFESKDQIYLDDYFNQANLDNGSFVVERNVDEYTVSKFIHSGYGNVTYQLGDKWYSTVGLRVDKVDLTMDYYGSVDESGDAGRTVESTIDKLYVLPSLNVKYEANDKNAIRFGASKTYTLPQTKEISPFRYVDIAFVSQGNPDLQPSTNYNLDLKWDNYLSSSEILSVSTFAKYIQDPISRVEKGSSAGFLTYENISESGIAAGVELEFRKNIYSVESGEAGWDKKLSFGLNGSYTYTHVDLSHDPRFTNETSQLEGAAPFIANADLSYNLKKGNKTITTSMVMNYFSDRVYTIGVDGHQDIIEKGVPTLDFVASAKLGNHWGLNLKAQNLLNADYQLSKEPNIEDSTPVIISDYKKGVFFSVGLTYNF